MIQIEVSVDAERRLLQDELRFFDSHEDSSTSPNGLLTESNPAIMTLFYPPILRGMLTVYGQINRRIALVDGAADKLYITVLAARAKQGEMVSNTEARNIRDKIEKDGGEQGKALEAHSALEKEEEAVGYIIPFFGARKERRGFSTEITEEEIIRNKRNILEAYWTVKRSIEIIYGDDVDHKDVLLTELLLEAPFVEEVVKSQGGGQIIEDERRKKHERYIESSSCFSDAVDLEARIKAFEDLTSNFPADVVERSSVVTITESDKEYVTRLHQVAKAIRSGEWSLDDLYSLLGETLFIKSNVFEYSSDFEDGEGEFMPAKLTHVSFDDIAGYREMKSYYQVLLDRLSENSPALADVRIVLIIGKAGIGKSLGIKAFISNLPENAMGIMFDYKKTRRMPRFEDFVRLATLHKNKHLFVVLEDIEKSSARNDLLEIDAVTPNEIPPNLHFIATTTNPVELDDALLRPGRSKIFIIKDPDETDRREIAELHSGKRHINLSPELIADVVRKTKGFTPAEIEGIMRELHIEGIIDPTVADIERHVAEIKGRKNIKGLLKKLSHTLGI